MTWTAPSGHVWTTGEIVTAANMNTYIANNLMFLGSAVGQFTATASSTNNTAYSDLGAAGPAVTLTTLTTALILLSCVTGCTTKDDTTLMGVAISGATTAAANDQYSAEYQAEAAGANNSATQAIFYSGLTGGSNTFTAKYRTVGGVGSWSNRSISVIPLTT